MKRLYALVPVLVILTLASCGDSAIFLSTAEEPAKVRVETINPGLSVLPGAEIPFQIARDPVFVGDPESADALVVELLDAQGVLLGDQTYTSVDQADELPPLQLADLGDGLFVLRFRYMDGDEVVVEELIPFFVNSDPYTLLGLSTYPASLYPGSAGLVSVNLEMPIGTDPYLRWYLDDSEIQSGFLSESGEQLELQAPGKSGVYTVRVELYPSAPILTGEMFENVVVPAPYAYETELVVSTEPSLDPTDLAPERSYYVLHHFLGDLRDSGARPDLFRVQTGSAAAAQLPSSARAIGDPDLTVASDIFGYRLDGDDGFELSGFILPARETGVSPFSISLRLRPDLLVESTRLFHVDAGAESILQADVDTEGHILLELGRNIAIPTPYPVLFVGRTSVVTVSYWPVGEQALVQLYVDGEIVVAESVDWTIPAEELPDPVAQNEDGWVALAGSTVIGGDDGFVGIIDEFGVYFRDEGDRPSPDTQIFASAMVQAYGDKLVYAEGFEGPSIPDSLIVQGDVEIAADQLVLGPGGVVRFPTFGFSSEELFVTVTLDALVGSSMSFYAEYASASDGPDTHSGGASAPDEESEARETAGEDTQGDLDTAATVSQLVTELLASDADLENAVLEFSFSHSGAQLVVHGPADSQQEIVLEGDGDFAGLRLEVAQSKDAEAQVAVESVVAWRGRPEIPATLLEPAPDTDEPATDES